MTLTPYFDESNLETLLGLLKSTFEKYATLEGVETSINSAIKGISGISFKKEDVLPESGETGVIYLIPNNSEEDKNVYNEYFWNEEDSKFELLGNTKTDLSGYVTKDELSSKNYLVQSDLDDYVMNSDLETLDTSKITEVWNKVMSDLSE